MFTQLMQSQGFKARYIRQIKLAGAKNYFPNKFYSPYEFLTELEAAARKKYEVRVIEVRYIISKSKNAKDIDDHFTLANLTTEEQYNNVFSLEDPFLKRLLSDCPLLTPPQGFDPNQFDLENNAAKKQQEQRRNQQVDSALQLLMDIHQISSGQDFKAETRSLSRFKKEIQPFLRDSEVDIYVKVLTNTPTEDAIEKDKNSKNPIVVSTNTKQEIRVHLHPVKGDSQSAQLLAELHPISEWALSAVNPEVKSGGVTYWSIGELTRKMEDINPSVKILSFVSLHRNKKGNFDYFEIYSFLFNEIVLKAVVHLAQIKRVEKWIDGEEEEYYFHLAYPPRYYVALLKPDVGCDNGFIRSWQRVQNFTFLRNSNIMKDEFLRLYLFSNTLLRVRLNTKDPDVKVASAKDLLQRTLNRFKGTIRTDLVQKPYDFGRKLVTLATMFKYGSFKGKFDYGLVGNLTADKAWKFKYLLLVLVRYNQLLPTEIDRIVDHVNKAKEDIDIYLYIFWQRVVLLNTVSPEGEHQRDSLAQLQQEFTQIKKLSIADITRRVSTNTDQIAYVFKASLTPSGYLYNPPTPEMKGRLLKEYSAHSEHFLRVTITDDNEGSLKNQKYITRVPLKKMMQDISVLQRKYIPLGWSPSQLRSYSLWYIHQVTQNRAVVRQQVLSFLGQFDDIENPAKRAARIGQAFSSSWTYECKTGEIHEEYLLDDYSPKGYMYTDGIGKVSRDLVERISLKLQIRNLSVIQVRYKGVKGLLVVDPNLPSRTIQLRPSMIKYDCRHDAAAKYLDILDWNKYKAGFLNRQTIVLLKTLGIPDKVFEKRHAEHIDRLSSLSFKDCSIFKHMNEDLNSDVSNLEPANVTILHLLRAGFRLESEPFFRGVLQTMKKNGYHQLKVKSNILIQKSARIIGIIDQWNILQEGELYCTIEDDIALVPVKQHVQGPVIITRNPCLHPADIRKMHCVSIKVVQSRFQARGMDNIFQNYINCVIFPKKGDIPVTSQISGSDLDGDNFFISWDPELIPKNHQDFYVIDAPATGDKGKKTGTVKKEIKESYQEMLNFFVEYLNYEKLGQIDNSHLVHADRSPFYAKAKECVQLAILHGKAVDFPKSGFCPQVDPKLLVSTYPDFMQKQQSPEYISESILGRLYRDIKERIRNLLSDCQTQKTVKIDEQLIKELQGVVFEAGEIREAIDILQAYERELAGLITLVGVDTQYEIYSGNFSIAKDKVKAFGKNRLIATILTLRRRYFQEFFSGLRDKEIYQDAQESALEKPQLFTEDTRRRALLFYLTSYILKYCQDSDFLSDPAFVPLRQAVLAEWTDKSWAKQGKFCGFVWFVLPKVMINLKYRARRAAVRPQEGEKLEGQSLEEVIEEVI